jgi:hypothetical protein
MKPERSSPCWRPTSWTTWIHSTTKHGLFKIHFSIIYPSNSGSPKWPLLFMFPTEIPHALLISSIRPTYPCIRDSYFLWTHVVTNCLLSKMFLATDSLLTLYLLYVYGHSFIELQKSSAPCFNLTFIYSETNQMLSWSDASNLGPVALSGIVVVCLPLYPRFASSKPAEGERFLRATNISRTSSFGGEVKPSAQYRTFTAWQRTLLLWKRYFVDKI